VSPLYTTLDNSSVKGNDQTVLVGSDRGSMTSPAGIPQGQTDGRFIAEICDWVQGKMLEERDTERHDLRLPRVATL
jgi:hypothetical protein